MSEQSKKELARAVVGFYWRSATKYRRHIAGLALLLPITVLVNQIIPPIILANVINRLGNGDYIKDDIWGSFGPQLLLFAALQLLGSLVIWRAIDFIVWRLEANVQRDMARRVFNHLTSQTADFHANNFGGSLVSQTNKLLSSYVRISDTTVFNVTPLILGVTFSVIVLSRTAWIYSIVLLIFAIFYTITSIYVTKKVRDLGSKHAQLESTQTGLLADAITNIMTIKSFAGKKHESARYNKATQRTHDGLIKLSYAHQKQMAYFSGMIGIIGGVSLAVAVISVLKFNANVASVFLIFSYTASVSQQLFLFSNAALRNYNRAIGDASDMVKILNQEPAIVDPVRPIKAHINRGDIRFDGVVFKHDGADDPIFDELKLHIKQGEQIGLVGHSGSGKSTLTRVLLRFSDIQAGAIKIDNQDISKMTQDDLHRHIAYVPQEPLLFHRSILENIRYGDPDASIETVQAVARMASAHEFILKLPQGYKTLVGERGVKLSGGQRQRIAIARAMLKNAPILVLDEATSALDSESEVLIQKALWKLMEGRTAIVIAHRLSTIQKMDRIIVLDNGRIVEQGSHGELLKKGGTYATLWAHQSGGFIED